MSSETAPVALTISLASLVNLGVEYWRLGTWLSGAMNAPNAATARHALRKMGDFLKSCELSVASLDGHPFDAGMAARVVDTIDDPELPHGKVVIAETVSPLVLWRGQVVKTADVVTRNGTRKI